MEADSCLMLIYDIDMIKRSNYAVQKHFFNSSGKAFDDSGRKMSQH